MNGWRELFDRQRAHYPAVRATTAAQRIEKLRHFHDTLLARRGEVIEAVRADFRRPMAEVDMTESAIVLRELRHAMRNLRRWMRPRSVRTPLGIMGTSSEVRAEPRGVTLILSPWNYPVQLAFLPLISAIAAGNCVVLKPSEITPNSAAWMRRFLADLFPPDEIAVAEGDATVATELLRLPFDHIFFTGSPAVGKIVMRAAAEHLASVTLELGGKSPCVVDETADLEEAATKIAWGKFANSGQTCIAPDYVLVDERVREALTSALRRCIGEAYGGDAAKLASSPDFGRIVNARHHQRLRTLVDDAVGAGATVLAGGESDGASNYLAPTLIGNVACESALLHDEIFGPVLPIVAYHTFEEALAFINAREKPLALYIFSRSHANVEAVLNHTSAGGTCVNETLLHYFNENLPFGGAGNSGLGRAHGHAGFLSFSNERAVLRRAFPNPLVRFLYPPFGRGMKWLVNLLAKYL
ncbi:aldehyde dehydrogenase [Verrucomicrobia bacterium SCGC AG-212-E04]|nr:aldehyde dehydrogenase [Verrucomicrobia bacterium SCGC AG-212-E04]